MQNNTFSTLFVGQNLIKLSAVDSTNNFLKLLLSKSEPLPEGTVIMADEQFSGRGQQNNIWQAAPGKNLTFSLLLKPVFIAPKNQFLLNMAISVALYQALSVYVPKGISIKWPNDIYYKDQKMGGILIENTLVGSSLKSAVVGIGLNVNQAHFNGELTHKAVSLCQILQKEITLQQLLQDICSQIEGLYLQLKAKNYHSLTQSYINQLYKINKPSNYRHNGEVFEGVIKGVTENGLLCLEKQGLNHTFNFKEIEFLT